MKKDTQGFILLLVALFLIMIGVSETASKEIFYIVGAIIGIIGLIRLFQK